MSRRGIVLVGAGSAMFTQGLVADLILHGDAWQLGMVDTDPTALQTAKGLAERMVQTKGADITIEASTDRCDLLPGASVVVSTIGVGGRRAWVDDVVIPRKYGVYQPVGDTAMPGGISRALRMIPAMVDIAKDVLRLCPEARFFNYANPMTANCWAVRKATGANMVGLCIGVHHVQHQLAHFIGAPLDEVTYLAAGLNHFTWIYDLRWKGEDAWPLVRSKLAEERQRLGGSARTGEDVAPGGDTTLAGAEAGSFVADNPFSWSLFDAYGAYPAVNDRHVVEFFPERFPDGAYPGGRLGIDSFSFERVIEHGDEIYARMSAQARGELPLDAGLFGRASGEHSQLLEILDAIEQDKRSVFAANVPNRGAIASLPDDVVLELSSMATGIGLQPLQMPDLADALAAPLRRKLASISLTVEAALTGSRDLFVEALLADGALCDVDAAGKLADELLVAQARYLPQFA
ncbi:MAG: family 4 glycosyl hydrolase [Anaerolineae bacterium]